MKLLIKDQVRSAPALIMSGLQAGSSLRALVLTPDRMPTFVIPSRSSLLCLSPRPCRVSPDRTRLLSDPEEDSPVPDPPEPPVRPEVSGSASPRFLLRLRRPAPAAATSASAEPDTDVTTRAAMSLQHVAKVTTPYGFRAALAASPCTRRRESLFHRNKPVTVTVTEADPDTGPGPGPSPGPSKSRVKVLGLQLLKVLSPRRPAPR
ncbi:C2 calcium-dependent domain-containing protein 4B-like [Mugil cephalus]|uniref:C2 calcium-dependent domain-containing protein 4B-like n=1 Tax=Mugil cephalus TaxID=48193 RepID=UPI001FB79E2B|nr:C2 calcium-dependent domain-containing protein 4B-like [Mugil cephalus]